MLENYFVFGQLLRLMQILFLFFDKPKILTHRVPISHIVSPLSSLIRYYCYLFGNLH